MMMAVPPRLALSIRINDAAAAAADDDDDDGFVPNPSSFHTDG